MDESNKEAISKQFKSRKNPGNVFISIGYFPFDSATSTQHSIVHSLLDCSDPSPSPRLTTSDTPPSFPASHWEVPPPSSDSLPPPPVSVQLMREEMKRDLKR